MNKANILFIGGGNMGRAIISGLIKQGYDPHCIYVVDPNLEKRQQLLESYQLHVSANLEEFLPLADVIFLAVKPQDAKDLCVLIGKQLKNRSVLVISIMAGINLSSLNQCLGHDLAIVRAMPNTPAIIQAGATGLFANAQALAEHKVQAESILKAVGMTAWLNKEEDIDSITALSGSGPA
ncbi:MAG: pyrroline-5-carboxylate reductase, partial [Gammaproteobacteria bacterium]|nr:pyrroline-5-carboxylate reductase [Gammaproteobacteria bacterium]